MVHGAPDKVRARWALGGVGLTVLAIGVAVVLGDVHGLGLIGLALVVVGLVFLVGAGRMPARTAKGTAMLRRVRGFRQVIETADRYFAQWAEQENVFPKMLPYAIVFGLTEKWAAAFASLAQDPTTTSAMAWYVPAQRFLPRRLRRVDRRVHGGHERHDRLDARGLRLERVRRRRVLGGRRRWRRRRFVVNRGRGAQPVAWRRADHRVSKTLGISSAATGRRWCSQIPPGRSSISPRT